MTTRTITAIYDSESEARQAREQLVDNGVDDDQRSGHLSAGAD